MSLPSGWAEKESRSRPGVKYYVNKYTNETTWDFPTEPAGPMLEVSSLNFHLFFFSMKMLREKRLVASSSSSYLEETCWIQKTCELEE